MYEEKYLFQEKQFIIYDLELDIDIEENSLLPSLPENLTAETNDHNLIIKKNKQGKILRSFFEFQGKLHGQCRFYYPNGKLESDCFYSEGKLHGPSRFYSEEGVCLSETWFYQNRKHGKAHRYDFKGKLSCIERFKGGALQGKQEYYYSDGSLKSELFYENGFLEGMIRLFWQNGQKKRECTFHKGIRNGWDRIWNEKGQLLDEGNFEMGDPVGIHQRFYTNGILQEEKIYHSPIRFNRKEWDAEGKLTLSGHFDAELQYIEKTWKNGNYETKTGWWDGDRIKWQGSA